MADSQTQDTLADLAVSCDELPSLTPPSDVIDMLRFEPRELNMLGFELDDDVF